jgi:exoribonuclease R
MRRVRLEGPTDSFTALRAELGLPTEFPPEVIEEAEHAAKHPRLPDKDLTDLEFVTIDPPGSRDLDQAMHLARDGDGFTVHYAIADVAAFVEPGGAIDREAHARGLTLYSPDIRTPLHPPALSEDAASLLPNQTRPAIVWTLSLDANGELAATDVQRAFVRSRAQLTYAEADQVPLLREIGEKRIERETERGGAHLPLPAQEVACVQGGWSVRYRAPVPAEDWNAQISLLTGIAAAQLMLRNGTGILRTVPEPGPRDIARLRLSAEALHAPWPADTPYADWVRTLDPQDPKHAALMHTATALLRGAAYAAFDGEPPAQRRHFAIAAEYAHVTAPLRRLVDRYALECCLAACTGEPPPEWVRTALPTLPDEMAAAGRRASSLERAVIDLVEAEVLQQRVGEAFDAVVVDEDPPLLQLTDPAVRARFDGEAPAGARVRARLVEADPATRAVRFAL